MVSDRIYINAEDMDHRSLNKAIQASTGPCTVEGCCGQRFLASGMSGRDIIFRGIPGNALGAYLNGGTLLTQCIKYGASDSNNHRLRVGMYFNGGTLKIKKDILII